MSIQLADRLDVVKPSPSMAAKARVDALRATGQTIIDFTIGEPDFPTPAHIAQSGIDAIQHGETCYTSSTGTLALRQAIVNKLRNENGLDYQVENIIVGSGAKQVIFNAFAATLNPGDEVIVPAPYWVSYPDMAALHGAHPVFVDCPESQGFKLTPDRLESAISPKTRWLVLNTPNNPTGAVYSHDELMGLAKILKAHPQVLLMTDEIYEHFVYGGVKHVCPAGISDALRDRTLLINGLSKSYAFTGWRIGYGAGPTDLIKAINLLMSQSTSCASSISQAAAVIALNGPQDCVRKNVADYEMRRDLIVKMLNDIPGVSCLKPNGAFYVFPCVKGLIGLKTPDGKTLGSDVDIMNFFLDSAKVATIDGTSYGMSPYLRISFATTIEAIEHGCKAIKKAVMSCSN